MALPSETAALTIHNIYLMRKFPQEIFKAYDIRGIFQKTLTAELVEAIGHAIGSEARVGG